MVEGKTLTTIVDHGTGATLLESNTVGEIIGYEIDSGPRAFIPLRRAYEHQKDRRIKFLFQVNGITHRLLYPEQMEFVTEQGLLKVLMEGRNIVEVSPLAPAPAYRSDTFRPFSATFYLDSGLHITLICDRASGVLDVELEADEM